jgi:hypothetical protein
MKYKLSIAIHRSSARMKDGAVRADRRAEMERDKYKQNVEALKDEGMAESTTFEEGALAGPRRRYLGATGRGEADVTRQVKGVREGGGGQVGKGQTDIAGRRRRVYGRGQGGFGGGGALSPGRPGEGATKKAPYPSGSLEKASVTCVPCIVGCCSWRSFQWLPCRPSR